MAAQRLIFCVEQLSRETVILPLFSIIGYATAVAWTIGLPLKQSLYREIVHLSILMNFS